MKEEFLHYIWQFQKFNKTSLKTTKGKSVQIVSVGVLNVNSGPDFYNSRIVIENQEWYGTVEIHLKSSDWYLHNHQDDPAYNNVILHVVWDNDGEVLNSNKNVLEVLELKELVSESLISTYKGLVLSKKFINCENRLHTINDFTLSFWKQKLLFNRLNRKVKVLNSSLERLNYNWEALLYELLLKNFGLKINSSDFELLSKVVPFHLFRKEISSQQKMEALLFGQGNLLRKTSLDDYHQNLLLQYSYLKQKYRLQESYVNLQFFRLRPSSFPTIRLSQFSMLYNTHKNLFSQIISIKTLSGFYSLFSVSTSNYWETHFVLGKSSMKKQKLISKSFVDLIILNTIIPLKYAHAKSRGDNNIEDLLKLYTLVKPESNSIISKFKTLKIKASNSLDSQSLIELKTEFCDKNKCLNCDIGNKLLNTL